MTRRDDTGPIPQPWQRWAAGILGAAALAGFLADPPGTTAQHATLDEGVTEQSALDDERLYLLQTAPLEAPARSSSIPG